ncbi:RHS repeat-associated core domain-containing protein [Paucibacter sp. R3-3]|uniref:RHS repeat-associated core domain-containing protein n=1 Tax=Roseateles agri TaxID=3098619 RepID=A0ABU5DAQ7_9BURK|nr:RHS repeat-associated core domain-containing protein [Paucibacter sp. R3-3]MDY0743357.1 RHS repeat-associated core domain-containing protein [Paucibacter sp. R3-3]
MNIVFTKALRATTSRQPILVDALIFLALTIFCGGVKAQTPTDPFHYSRTRSISYFPPGTTLAGLQSGELSQPVNPNLCVSTSYGYDPAFGNRTSITTSSCAGASNASVFTTRSEGVSYDAQGLFPQTSTNALSQAETTAFDPRFGLLTQWTDPNALTTSWSIDAFGRKTAERHPDGTSILVAYCIVGLGLDSSSNSSTGNGDPLNCPTVGQPGSPEVPTDAVSFVHSEPHDTNGNKMGPFVRIYIDRLGREVRRISESFDGSLQPGPYRGTMVVSDTTYSVYGARILQTQPYFLSTASSTTSGSSDVGVTAFKFDALGRTTAVYTVDDQGSLLASSPGAADFGQYGGKRRAAVLAFSYSDLKTAVTDDHGRVKTEERNAIGELVRVTDALGAQIAYQRDAFGNLLVTKDALQNVIEMSYDLVGHKLSSNDPDAGISNFCYDAFGQLVAQQNANMRVSGASTCPSAPTSGIVAQPVATWTTMAYDAAGRMRSRVEPEMTSTWYFEKNKDGGYCMAGSGAARGAGRLCETTTDSGLDRKYVYDNFGRPLGSRFDTGVGPSFATALTYDGATGRAVNQTYPTGLQVAYDYTALGYLEKLKLVTAITLNPLPSVGSNSGSGTGQVQGVSSPANSSLWQAQAVNAWGNVEFELFGNAVRGSSKYDPYYGRMIHATVGANTSSAPAMDLTFAWDSVGNLMSRSDGNGDTSSNGLSSGAVTDSFHYDALNRLSSYEVDAPGISGMSRTVALQYNALGMLLYKSDVGNYSYNSAGQAHPHAVQVVNGAAPITYNYDANGNLLAASDGKYRGIEYSSFNLPSSRAGVNASFAGIPNYVWQYDEDHQRVKEVRVDVSGTRTIWYMHPDNRGGLGFESEVETDGAISNRHFLNVGGRSIGVLVTTGPLIPLPTGQTSPTVVASATASKIEYWHRDYLGSLVATTDHTGAVTERYAYDPFGKRRHVDGNYDADGQVQADWNATRNWGSGRGFAGHEQMDDISLVHMNGRIFDPTLGVFLQADPLIQNITNLQAFHRYSYCGNSPLTCIDPTGYESEWLPPVLIKGPETAPLIDEQGWSLVEVPNVASGSGYLADKVVIYGRARTNIAPTPVITVVSFASTCGATCSTYIQAGRKTVRESPEQQVFRQARDVWQGSGCKSPTVSCSERNKTLYDYYYKYLEKRQALGNFDMDLLGVILPIGKVFQALRGGAAMAGGGAAAREIGWTSSSVRVADKALSQGASSVTVASRAEAEELFLGRYQGAGYRNSSGFDGVGTKQYFGSKQGTYHWDDVMGADGLVAGHAPGNPDSLLPHLQIAPIGGGSTVRIFFPW